MTYFTPRERAQFSLARALQAASEDALRGTLEAEMLAEAALRAGRQTGPLQFFIPFELLKRDLSTVTAGGLVGVETPDALDVLRPASIVVRAGAQVHDVTGDVLLPRVTAAGTAYWLNGDGTGQATESQATIGALAMTPKSVVALTEISGQLMRQSNTDAFLRREMVRTIGTALDAAVLAGSGVNGEPLGIHNSTGIDAQDGANIEWADLVAMIEAVSEANAIEPIWIMPPNTQTVLLTELTSDTFTPVNGKRALVGYERHVLSNAPSATLTLGDFSQVQIAIWGDGIDIQVDPYTSFTTGKVSYRAWLTCDVGVSSPAAFSVATGVSLT